MVDFFILMCNKLPLQNEASCPNLKYVGAVLIFNNFSHSDHIENIFDVDLCFINISY